MDAMHEALTQISLPDVEFVPLVFASSLPNARDYCGMLEEVGINAVIGDAPKTNDPDRTEMPVLVAKSDFEMASEIVSARVAAQGDDLDDDVDDDPFDDDDFARAESSDADDFDDDDDDEPNGDFEA